jgi:hypothetical protein
VEEVTENLENPVFGNTSFRGPISSIKSVQCVTALYKYRLKLIQTISIDFDKMNFFSPFFAAKTEI